MKNEYRSFIEIYITKEMKTNDGIQDKTRDTGTRDRNRAWTEGEEGRQYRSLILAARKLE